MKSGIIVTDVQGDFTELKNGSLAVKGTDQKYVDEVRITTRMLKDASFPIFAIQDWHPPEHISFFTNHEEKKAFETITLPGREQVLWPPHCVQESEGAKLLLEEKMFEAVIKKGTHIEFDSYSGFQDDGGNKTPLHPILQTWGIERVVIYGIATDYCVKATALDALNLGYQVMVIRSLCRGVEPETSNKAFEEMERKGIVVLDQFDFKKFKNI